MRAWSDVLSTMQQRREADGHIIRQMIEARDRYNGGIVIPLTDVDGEDGMETPTRNMVAGAVDGTAMRAASVDYSIVCPWLKETAQARKNADTRRRMLYASHAHNQMDIKLYRAYRHLVAYGSCAWVVMPDDDCQRAKVELRDPLTSYPELRAADDIRDPANVGFVFGRSRDWLSANYGAETMDYFGKPGAGARDTLWDVVEWIDEDQVMMGILGPREEGGYQANNGREPYAVQGCFLKRWDNKAGRVPVVVPRRVTLDRIQGQLAGLFGSIDLFGRMTALEIAAAEKGIFPDLVMLGEQNMTPVLINGNWRDGRTGEVNSVTGARDIKYLTNPGSPIADHMVQNLEDSIEQNSGAAGVFGGQNPNGLRTGQAISTMGSFSVDPRVEEAQKIMQAALTSVDESIIEVEKGYYPKAKTVAFTGLQGDDRVVSYTPETDLDSNANVVRYPIPGADISQTSVAVSQLSGSGLMSRRTARVMHPWISDADLEDRQIEGEKLQDAMLSGIQQQAAAGQIPPADVAKIMTLIAGGMTAAAAITQAHNEAQARQATQAPPPGPDQSAAPQTMPGIAQPGAGAEQPPGPPGPQGAIPPPSSSISNLHQILGDLRAAPPSPPTGGPA